MDFIFRGAQVIDGTGSAARQADVAVSADRIVAVGTIAGDNSARDIDAKGLTLTPGFIDVHTHDDRAVLSNPTMDCKISQGVTTVVTGNCGISLAPLSPSETPPAPADLIGDRPEHYFGRFGGYLDALDADPASVNVIAQVGHSTLRMGAMDTLERPATAREVATMRGRLEEALVDGAVGMSTGLFYRPANDATTEEVIELARALAPVGAMHSTHMRDETVDVLKSIDETCTIGRETGVPIVISHHKCAGQPNHGRTMETLPRIAAAHEHQPLALDVYPYVAGSTVLDARRMRNASRVIVTWSKPHPEVAGRDFDDIAKEWGLSTEEAAEKMKPGGAIYFLMDEEDVQRVMASPRAMIGSDGLPHDSHPHPRLWGTFPRVLGHYARDLGLFPLEDAVRRMTGFPAAQFGISGRGVIREGAYADLVLFDADTIIDRSTFADPIQPAGGVSMVMVNGRVTWQDGEHAGARAGRALRLSELGPKGRDS